jgi:hypothetical protein
VDNHAPLIGEVVTVEETVSRGEYLPPVDDHTAAEGPVPAAPMEV